MRILFVRRDHIGDLLLSTPLLAALRRNLPAATIDVLTNDYSAPILAGNPDVDRVHTYGKWTHAEGVMGRVRALGDRLAMLRAVRSAGYDVVVLGKPEEKREQLVFARLLGRGARVGVVNPGSRASTQIDLPVVWDPTVGEHIVERSMLLGRPLGVDVAPGPLRIFPDAMQVMRARERLSTVLQAGRPLLAIQLSARKPRQRWPAERFAALMHALHLAHGVGFVLLWSPGAVTDRRHPGDDAKAADVLRLTAGLPRTALETRSLPELVAGLSLADAMITSDGGAMHIGVALGLPIVAFFGTSTVAWWRPWQVPHVVLQPESRCVEDITVDEAAAAYEQLRRETACSPAGSDVGVAMKIARDL